MDIVEIAVKDLRPYEKNAKKHDQTQINNVAKSIEKYGFVQPIVVDKNNEVIIGHCRLEASKKLKLKKVPCVLADTLTEEQVKELRLLDNKLNESDWDFDLLGKELADLDLSDFDLDWGVEEKQDMVELEEDNFDVNSNIPDEPKSKLGDIYQLGNHRLMCGSSTNIEDMNKLFDGKIADLVVTDPPYNVNYGDKAKKLEEYDGGIRNKNKILNDNMADSDFHKFLLDFYTQMNAKLKNGGAFYIFHADSEGYNFRSALKEAGLTLRQTLIWVKNQLVMGRQDYQWKHEPCLYGWKDGAGHYFTKSRKNTTTIETDDLETLEREQLIEIIKEMSEPSSVIRENKPQKNDLHPTMKPIRLCGKLIQNSSRENEIVFDGFAGSGSTLIACEQLKRKCYAIELDPHYVDVIIKRWEDFSGEKAVKLC